MLGKAIDIFCKNRGIEDYSIQFERITYKEISNNLVLDANNEGLYSHKLGSSFAFVYDFLMAGLVDNPSNLNKGLVTLESDLEKGINYAECCKISEVAGLVVMQSDLISIHTNRLEIRFPAMADLAFSSIDYGYVSYILLIPR